MKQEIVASLAWSSKGRTTRRERFLAETNAVVPWERLWVLIARFARAKDPRSGKRRGRCGRHRPGSIDGAETPSSRFSTPVRLRRPSYGIGQVRALRDHSEAIVLVLSIMRNLSVSRRDDFIGTVQNDRSRLDNWTTPHRSSRRSRASRRLVRSSSRLLCSQPRR